MKSLAESVNQVAEKIRNLEIRGARNVAIAAVKALKTVATHTKAKSPRAFVEKLLEAKRVLRVQHGMRKPSRFPTFRICDQRNLRTSKAL